uniref:Uncharacterized protein n=4 Tax=Nymphaea colorata TaxID=210225 RepID=A0A5K0XKR0_9MAGN
MFDDPKDMEMEGIASKTELCYPPLELSDFPPMDTLDWRKWTRNYGEESSLVEEILLHVASSCASHDTNQSNSLSFWSDRHSSMETTSAFPHQEVQGKHASIPGKYVHNSKPSA